MPQGTQWEYLILGCRRAKKSTTYNADYEARLKELGLQGWELVTIDSEGVLHFKRPLGWK